ncbi:MAG: Dam family site-specific DNA-(adenine-N6)-methyltransferase [Candidatus Latescibacteria bacterium]|nr:Dam family site-specific DNA-(adenine-N6)-methyltransferase [Candidatus Latescibacterota bacterium]
MIKAEEGTLDLFYGTEFQHVAPFRTQLLKWIGNKQRFAHKIASFFPKDIGVYYEPFLGSGAVLAALQPPDALGSDICGPLMEIWKCLRESPETLVEWYRTRYDEYRQYEKPEGYERIKARYNADPNGADLLFICRSCYGGVVRFRKSDGYLSTPCGIHDPITPSSFAQRVQIWRRRTSGARFEHIDFEEAIAMARDRDLVYCDPPYIFSQSILYRGQGFSLERLIRAITECKKRGGRIALSIDGKKKSGRVDCDLMIPEGLFEREVFLDCGRSMLRRFQREGESLEDEVVHDRLLLTY